jgi:hypothetical protein
MGATVKKTEHAGAKHGEGAAWAPKKLAKKESSRLRRKNGRREIRDAVSVPLVRP